MLAHLLESSVSLLLFYVVYILLFSKHTYFKFNRAYLLVTLFISIIIPWLDFETSIATVNNASVIISKTLISAPQDQLTFSIKESLQVIYIIGVIVSFGIFSYKLFKLQRLIKNGKKSTVVDYHLIHTDQNLGVCSFLKYIIVPKAYTPTKIELIHEKSHISQYHSLDIIITWLYIIIFWFNPISYLYLIKMTEVHEFLADQSAINEVGKSDYQNHILHVLSQKLQPQLVHNFNSIIKTRLTMMNSNTKPSIMSYLAAVLVVFTTVFLLSCHAKKVTKYVMTTHGLREVTKEIVTDTVLTIDSETFEETVSYLKKEIYFIIDTTIVIDYDTYEERINIVKTFLEPQDLIDKKK